MGMDAWRDGHYLLITAAGMVGTTNRNGAPHPGNGKDPVAWLRVYIVMVVITVWSVLNVAAAFFHAPGVPYWVHLSVLVVVASLFRVEFGGIRLVTKGEDKDVKP